MNEVLEEVFVEKREFELEDLKENSLTEVFLPWDNKKKLLAFRYKNKEYLTGYLCPHYNLPLKDAIIYSGTLVCPFHMATFDIETGNVLDGPSINNIKSIPIKTNRKNGRKYIELLYDSESSSEENWSKFCDELYNGCIPKYSKRDLNNSESITIIGGGVSSLVFSETLRKNGFTGSITVFEKSNFLPYEKTLLSKNLNIPIEQMFLRSDEHITQKLSIDFKLNHEIVNIDFFNNKLIDSNNNSFSFKKLLIATGVTAKKLTSTQYQNLIMLNNINDQLELRNYNKKGNNIVIIGGGFNSVELSAVLSSNGCNITVVSKNQYPLEKSLGSQIGKIYLEIFDEKGIKFISGSTFKEFVTKADDKKIIEYVVLNNNTKLYADCFIVSIGSVPNTKLLFNEKKIVVDKYFRVKHNGKYLNHVFSVGDCISFPYLEGRVEIEHWNNSIQQARIAALNILLMTNKDDCNEFQAICDAHYKRYLPFFWITAFGISLRCIGLCELFDEVKIEGSLIERKFIAFYIKNKKVVSIASMGLIKVIAFLYSYFQNINKTFESKLSSYSADEIIKLLKKSALI